VNPITALLRTPNGTAGGEAGLPARRRLRAHRGAAGSGADEPRAELERVLQRTAANRSSMLQDVERARPTEIEAITGAVVAQAELQGVPVPVNRLLLALVRSLEHSSDRGEA
jgi:2-dehydropantoate 2-reductase